MTNRQALQALHKIQRSVLDMSQSLDDLELKEQRSHMIDPKIAAVISQIDAATTAVANRLQALVDQANQAGSVSADEIVAALQPEIARLTALGQDPNNPVPQP